MSTTARHHPLPLTSGNLAQRRVLLFVFFFSGIPALLYQNIWQRALFGFYGVNIQSITMIVADFMLGLGLGALLGAHLSQQKRVGLLVLFASFEVLTALFAVGSLDFLQWIGQATLHWPFPVVSVLVFIVMLLPTLAMGASLPLLTEYLSRRYPHLEENIALLYAANTFGAAFACFLAAYGLFALLGLRGSIYCAVCLNLIAALGAVLVRQQKVPLRPIVQQVREKRFYYLLLSACIGFIALSYEIIWLRTISVGSKAFAPDIIASLGFYLFGLAYGALILYQWSSRFSLQRATLFYVLLMAAFLGANTLPLIICFYAWGISVALPLVITGGTLAFGMLLPLLTQSINAHSEEAGKDMGFIYFTNILGATAGALLTGFVFLDWFRLPHISYGLFLFGLVLAGSSMKKIAIRVHAKHVGYFILLMLSSLFFWQFAYQDYPLKMLFKQNHNRLPPLKHYLSNNVGTISVDAKDTIYGGGAYDGSFNISPDHGNNRIYRAYFIPAFSPKAANVLLIGLSSGSWAQVMAHNPSIQQLDIIEINPDYLRLIQQYPQILSLLHNPKVHIITDDARRYLATHSDTRYDLIVMNTSFSWRAYTSLLLSVEMMEAFKQHLNPGGVLYYNSTFSKSAIASAFARFSHVAMLFNCVIASDAPLTFDSQHLEITLKNYQIDHKKSYQSHSPYLNKLVNTAKNFTCACDDNQPSYPFYTKEMLQNYVGNTRAITDSNMGDEFRLPHY